MIKSIEVVKFLGGVENESKVIELGAPETSGLWVKSIKGIGPGKANINTTDMASSDGGIFNSARSEVRNITMTLGIVDYVDKSGIYYNVEDVRRSLYKWFGKKNQLKIIFHTDRINLYTYGYIESNEPDIFNKQETTSISIICPDPNFYNNDGGDQIDFSATEDNFEFPMEFINSFDPSFIQYKIYYERIEDGGNYYYYITADESKDPRKNYYEEDFNAEGFSNEVDDEYFITEDEEFVQGKEYFELEVIDNTNQYFPTSDVVKNSEKTYYEYQNKVIFANILEIAQQDLFYDGEINVGVTIVINILNVVSGLRLFKLYNDSTYDEISLNDSAIISRTGSGLSPGDTIEICTISGKKRAVLQRGTEVYNIINSLGKNPMWFTLDKGINTFSYSADSGEEFVSLNIFYNSAYEGI